MQIRPTLNVQQIYVSPEYFFSKRERMILGLLLKGYTFEQMSKRFDLTEYGIRSIADRLYGYLECEEVLEHLNNRKRRRNNEF